MQTALMLGCGHGEVKRKIIAPTSAPESETQWITVDIVPSTKPTILYDLENLSIGGNHLPVADSYFDEIHAYEVLEHFGRQGDFRAFFRHFEEFWRILKPGGLLIGSCPSHQSVWQFGDPGHTRSIQPETFCHLTREHYAERERTGKWLDASADYRDFVRPCWWIIRHSEVTPTTAEDSGHFLFALEKDTSAA